MAVSDTPTSQEMSPELQNQLHALEEEFLVSLKQLKQIKDRFKQELTDGLQKHNQNIPMNLAWVTSPPTGHESGTYLTLDLGGTNLRVCKVTLHPDQPGRHAIEQAQYRIPDAIKTGTATELWTYIADSLADFLPNHDWPTSPIPLGFTFSYPCQQHRLDHGILQTWTKGFDIAGVEGADVAAQLRAALAARNLPVRLVALLNDTVGALIASAYARPPPAGSAAMIGAIFGTGCNAAYFETADAIAKVPDLAASGQGDGGLMAINCEYGAFDNDHAVLPRTRWDVQIDEASPRPGEQAFEKMSAGGYLGEVWRLVVRELALEKGVLFNGATGPGLDQVNAVDTGVLSSLEEDPDGGARARVEGVLGVPVSDAELAFLRRLAVLVALRGARLCACGVAAICEKRGWRTATVAADGGVVMKHPRFRERWVKALSEILGEEWARGIELVPAEDGSGVGAAIIVAMELQRERA